MTQETDQVYRASIGAIIYNDQKQVLMAQGHSFLTHQWDFVKGGMDPGEDELTTLTREIGEELGTAFKYEIQERSKWYLIYTWQEARQKQLKMRGQARVSYWVKYLDGELMPQPEELRAIKWVPYREVGQVLAESGWDSSEFYCLLRELTERFEE